MTQTLTKISLFLGLALLIISCNAVKNVPEGEYLLSKNEISIDSVTNNESKVRSLIYQLPNKKVFNTPLSLHIYNLANSKPDSTFQNWLHRKPNREKRMINFYSKKQVDRMGESYIGFNKWIQKVGDEPVIIEKQKIKKSIDRLEHYYASFGWFNTTAAYTIDTLDNKRASITYHVKRSEPYKIGTIDKQISSPVVDSLFQLSKHNSFIKKDNQYSANDFNNERDRITFQFRNSGLYHFDQSYIEFEADTVKTRHKANIIYQIPDRKYKVEDSTFTEPFKVHYITEVRIITDFNYKNSEKTLKDSILYNGYKLYSYEKLKFKPKAITDAVAITPNSLFKDLERTLTYKQINDLKIFKYPKISYTEDPKDSTGSGLIATIFLTQRKKYATGIDFDSYTSTIQQFGIGFNASFVIRNVFKRAEILELTAKGSVGSSKDAAINERFFNNSDIGADLKLSFPRILFPIKTDKLIPKYMSPSTSASIGFNIQNNIGLDRQNINTIYNYRWKPKKAHTNQIDLLNVQFVRNLNPENYYHVYSSSYNRLNQIAVDSDYEFDDTTEPLQLQIPEETNEFIFLALSGDNDLGLSPEEEQEVLEIAERQVRLSENNLIFATNYTWTRDTRENINDNNFYRIRWKIESAGALLKGIASTVDADKDEFGNYVIGDVAFSQYAKFEADYIKHWDLDQGNVLAFRVFGGIAIPYGNSNSIPFTRSYFAGGSNDNRGWRAYDLGPGSSGGVLDFNEANLKIAFNLEHRFLLFGDFKGALFADAGNIWNTLDNITDPKYTFTSIRDLQEIAVSTGFGLRYDFGFFVFRLDTGFKTYDPAYSPGERWFKDYNFGNAVYNIGINYPF